MVKVAIDSGPISTGSSYGVGTYVRELTRHLKGVDIVDFSSEYNSLIAKRYNVFHFTRFRPFFISLPFFKPRDVKFILTIYDLIPLIYPKHYPSGIRGWVKWQINKYLIRKNVDVVITISETSKKDIYRFLEIDPDKVCVTYLAPPLEYRPISDRESLLKIRKKYSLPEKFALCDADIYYSKNIPNLVKACEIANIPLVLIGGGEKTIKYARTHGFSHAELAHLKNVDWGGVLFLSSIDIEDLVKIYNLADVYIQPSFYEGFGIPLLQAIACKIPVVVSKTQCLVEVLGDDFNYVNPNDAKSIADGILNPNKNKKLPIDYSWDRTAKETLEVYKNV
jgi:glycosyltransferase involved in cell wall biosynthesis